MTIRGLQDPWQLMCPDLPDELPVFEEAWKGSARKHLPGWDEGFSMHGSSGKNLQ